VLGEGGDHHVQGQRSVELTHPSPGAFRVQHRVNRRVQERGLVVEYPEQRALGDPCGCGNLARGHVGTMLDQQRDHRIDDRAAALVGRERAGPLLLGFPGGGWRHAARLHE